MKEEKIGKKRFLGLGWIFILLLVGMLFLGLYRRGIYDRKLGVNVLFISRDGMGILTLHPEADTVDLVKLPDELKIPLNINGPEYALEALRKTGLPERDGGLMRIRKGVGEALGLVLPAFVKTDSELSLAGFSEGLWSFKTQTNLSLLDRYRLQIEIDRLVRRGLNLEVAFPGGVTDTVVEPDGVSFKKLNSAIYTWSKNQWVSEAALAETAEVGVVNASGVEGLGRVVARQLETAGVRVVEVLGSEKIEEGGCLFSGVVKDHPQTARLFSLFLNCNLIESLQDYLPNVSEKVDFWVVVGKRY